MKSLISLTLIGLTVTLSGCSMTESSKDSVSDYEKGSGGLMYKIVDDKATPRVGEVAFVSVSYSEATEAGTLISQTGKLDPRPSMLFARLPEFTGDFQDALQYLSEGDSALVKISIDSLKKHKGLLLHPDDNSRYMVFNLRINKVINKNGASDTIYPRRIEEYKAEQSLAHQAGENEKIIKYLQMGKLSYLATESGLRIPSSMKRNSKPVPDTVRVNYAFYTLDGKIMDTNRRALAASSGIYSAGEIYEPLKLTRKNAPIEAFREAISIVPPGTTVKLIIPSNLGFGHQGNNKEIPDFMPLVCEFEVLN